MEKGVGSGLYEIMICFLLCLERDAVLLSKCTVRHFPTIFEPERTLVTGQCILFSMYTRDVP